jgi:hypothetical protein
MRSLGRTALIASLTATLACGETSADPPGGAANGTAGGGGSTVEPVTGGTASSGAASAGVAGVSSMPSATGGAAGGLGGAPRPHDAGGEGSEAGTPGHVAPLDVDAILNSYRTFSPLTPDPVSVSGYIFGLCRLPTLPENEFLASVHGDGRFLRDWANEGARAGLEARGNPAFPAGATIVKEKYAGNEALDADLVAIGIMIKRDPGFDASRGDWEYAYYEPALGVVQSEEQSSYCASCHAGAAATDYVFVDGFER